MLTREKPYLCNSTLAERTADRMIRARNGLAHVMEELSTHLESEQAAVVHCWLMKVTMIVDRARIDAEASA